MHPRGWNSDLSHRRKLNSYAVEGEFYTHYADQCSAECRVPQLLGFAQIEGKQMIALEDLNAAGFSRRLSRVNHAEFKSCIEWLAAFHARFLGVAPQGLWSTGTYWHLATRPDELEVLGQEDRALFAVAGKIDASLNAAQIQTLVHGDAKLANFVF